LDDYHSDGEVDKIAKRNESVPGGGNLAPEVLKMLQQMAPAASNAEEEPDEIKVEGHCSTNADILCLANAFPAESIRRRVVEATVPAYISLDSVRRTNKTHRAGLTKTALCKSTSR
jgi:hypothetical protein